MNMIMESELKTRMEKSFERLHDIKYQLHIEQTRDEAGWPGDWEGRTLLGLVSLAQALGKEPLYLNQILDKIFIDVGDRGYYGIIGENIDEQQLSGNSWFLRSMCELYNWKKDERAYKTIQNCVNNLYMPLSGMYSKYPINPEQRVYDGEMAGHNSGMVVNGWTVSSDTGCAYIPLDGVTAAYDILKEDKLKALIEEMITNYKKIDFLGISAQTHATLSGLRGILRFAKYDVSLIPFAQSVFELYLTKGMTLNFENYNWFNRPEWTEPCAVVDSYICAVELFKATGDERYLNFAHYIYFSGLRSCQRPNGGFGCNSCATPENPVLEIRDNEAFWCCTMRGADGLAYVFNNSVLLSDGKAYILNYFNQTKKLGNMTISVETEYPSGGKTAVKTENISEVEFFIPEWTQNVKKTVNQNETVITFDIAEHKFGKVNMKGPCVVDKDGNIIGGNLISGVVPTVHELQ